MALSCATRAASCRNMAASIFCVTAWLWISPATAAAVISDDDPGAEILMSGVPHQALDLIGQLQLKVLCLVGFLQHHQVVLRHGIVHVRQVAVLRRDVAGLRDRPERVHVGRRHGRKVSRTPIANDALKCNGVRQRGGVGVDRHDRLNHTKELRDDRLDLRLRQVDLCRAATPSAVKSENIFPSTTVDLESASRRSSP